MCNHLPYDKLSFDFKQAFDRVSHQCLMQQLATYHLYTNKMKWPHSFLIGRTHQTSVNGILSSCTEVYSGTIQVSSLGPCIFNIFINSLLTKLQSQYTVLQSREPGSPLYKGIYVCRELKVYNYYPWY